jgi:hypothetical protein
MAARALEAQVERAEQALAEEAGEEAATLREEVQVAEVVAGEPPPCGRPVAMAEGLSRVQAA